MLVQTKTATRKTRTRDTHTNMPRSDLKPLSIIIYLAILARQTIYLTVFYEEDTTPLDGSVASQSPVAST